MKKTIIIILLTCFCCSQVYAAPAITTAPQTIEHKKDVVITGSGFGTHPDNSPNNPSTLAFKFDDFENGINGQVVENGWSHRTEAINYRRPLYTNVGQRANSTLCSLHNLTEKPENTDDGLGSFLYVGAYSGPNQLDWDEVYVTYWRYLNLTTVGAPQNYKEFRMEGDRNPPEDRTPMLAFDANWAPGTNNNHMKSNFIANYDPPYSSIDWSCMETYRNGMWDRHEFWIRIGDIPGQRFKYWENAQLRRNFQTPEEFPGDEGIDPATGKWVYTIPGLPGTSVGPHMGDDNTSFSILYFGFWIRKDSIGYSLFDDIYVSTTQTRVEIGDASTWSACTHREIQIPQAWSSSSITFTANQGSFADGETTYLYVVDENGNVNEQGYPVAFGQGLLGDVNQDGKVDIKDLILVAKDFGKTSGFNPACDWDGDGKVDIKDLIIVAKNFGKKL